jgi:tRNA 2-thiouridine synthesizing protein A
MECANPDPGHDAEWDAGDLGCGELMLHLRTHLKAIPGGILKVIARDRGASVDLPAYCRMTGHQLTRHDPGTCSFWIKARRDR